MKIESINTRGTQRWVLCFFVALTATCLFAPNAYAVAKCATFYEHTGYSGGTMTKCTDGGSVGTFLNDAFSSVKIPDGVYVKMCEHSANGDYGRCMFLYSDTPAFNSCFNNVMSYAKAYAYDPNNFQMIMASDS